MAELRYHVFPTDLGWLAALASENGLRALTLQPSPQEALDHLGPELNKADHDPAALEGLRLAAEAYMGGKPNALVDLPIDVDDATSFFKAAWDACRSIPPGETRSYGWLAEEAGRPRAFRAAGQAMARNRVALVVPCHRVVGGDGALHGYGMGGLSMKARLLEMERKARSDLT